MSSDDESEAFISEGFESEEDDDFESESENSLVGKKRKTPPKTKNNKSNTNSTTKKPATKKAATPKQTGKTNVKVSKKILDESSEDEVNKVKPMDKAQILKTISSSSSVAVGSLPTSSSSSLAMTKPPMASISTTDVSKGPDITTESEAKRVIMAYFRQQNRPYSAIQVHDNLHKRAPKSMIERVLTNLCESNAGLLCKEYGKAKIYFVDQNTFTSVPNEGIDDDIEALEASLNAENEREKRLRVMLSTLEAEPNDEDFDRVLAETETRLKPKDDRIATIKDQNIDPNTMNALIRRHNHLRNMWKTRKDSCKDVIDAISEGMGKKTKDVMNDLSIESDEMAGEQIPQVMKEIKVSK